MTWIVGMPSMFGYGMGISDIRVTLRDGSERDCLQKVYRVGPDIAAGFAGSVKIGFTMVQTLAKLLKCNEGTGWIPTEVAKWWPDDARQVFAAFAPESQKRRSDIMLVSAHPSESRGDLPWPRTYVHIFRSPDFEPEETTSHMVVSIGSGAFVEPCRRALEELSRDENDAMSDLMQAEVGNQGGSIIVLGLEFGRLLQQHQPAGISPHLHLCFVTRGRMTIAPNDHKTFASANEPGYDFTMPKVARSWQELQAMLRASGASADGCVT